MRTLASCAAPRILAVLLVVAGLSGTASAQQIQGSGIREVLGFVVRGVDSAYDPNTRTYLVVGGAGTLLGICINEQGVPVSGAIVINNGNYGAFPRAAYGGGGFLVVWPEETGAPSELHSRRVHCSGAVGPEQIISGGATAWIESGAGIAYSSTSHRFLVAWKSYPTATAPVRVKATLVDLNGTQFGPIVDLSGGFGRDPGVAWNPANDYFGVSYSGEGGPGGTTGFSGFALVPATNPAAFGRVAFNAVPGGMMTITDIAFNVYTGRYVMTWFEMAGGLYAKVAEIDGSGNIIATGIASALVGSYDALSLAFNPVTGTFAMVGLDRRNDNVLGLELNARGYPFNGANTIGALPTVRPARYTRVSSSTTSPTFNSTFSINFGSLGSLIATSFAGGGGPGGGFDAPPPAPPPPQPAPTGGCPTVQPGAGWTCVNGNWLPPGAGGGSPCPTVQPGAGWTCVNGNWLPPGAGPVAPAPSSGSSCPTVQPGVGWTCVNGNWLPPGAGGGSPCPTVQPGVGWTCVNGNWLPPGTGAAAAPAPSSCTTPQPGATWYCINGGWVPPNSPYAPATSSACAGASPAAGWVCTAVGGWVPPNHPLAGGGGDD
jgi:hypothetical protein